MCLGLLRIRLNDTLIELNTHSSELTELLSELADVVDTSSVRVLEVSFVCHGGAS